MSGAYSVLDARPAAERLQVILLGPPRVEYRGNRVAPLRRQVRALLYYLAAQPEPSSRARLCFLLWPDIPESDARRNLTHLLTHLRRTLPDPTLLLTSRDDVGLDRDRIYCDLEAFISLSDPEEQIDSLEHATALYRGPFLSGFSLAGSPEFEAWALQQQRECERLYLSILAALVEKCATRREYGRAIGWAQRYLAADELAEEIHGRLIILHAAAGNRTAALRQFERCATVLERELGVRPLPETRAIYESVLKDPQPLLLQPADPQLSWATLPGLDVPLVGRDAAYSELRAALAQAWEGRDRVVLLSGEPGIGKSRLMEAFATASRGQALVLAAAARSREQPLPYQLIVDLFRSLPDWRLLSASVEPVWLAEAARLFAELHDPELDLPPPLTLEPDEARTRLLEALCRVTLALAHGERPLLLCLDDLHWADSATLDWLICLARRMADQRRFEQPSAAGAILILGTYRTSEQEAVAHLRRNLVRLGVLAELRLTGLQSDAILEIVHHLTGPRPGAVALSERLRAATGGNPFFLLETLRILLEADKLPEDLTMLEQVPLPDSVREAIEARLMRLKPRTRQVLEAGAVLGPSFDFDMVHHTAGRGELETVDALEEAVARQFIAEHPHGYRFEHTLVRQAIEGTLGPVRRHLLHRRAARALEQLQPRAAGRIARHFDLGGQRERALHYYRHAAQEAEELFAWEEAEGIQSKILHLLDQLDPDRSTTEYLALQGQLLTSRAHVRFLQGRLEDRDADLQALAELARSTDKADLRLLAIIHRVRYLNLGGSYEDAISEGKEGLTLARRLDDPIAEAHLLAHAGFARYFLGQPRPALAALQSALDVTGKQMDATMRGRIAHILGYVHYHLGNYPGALEYHQQAYSCSEETGDHNRTAWNLMDIGFIQLKLGCFPEARECITESLAVARRIAARPAEAYALTLLADWELYSGNYAAALDLYRESLERQVEVGSRHGILAAEDGAGFAFYHLGDLDRARQKLERALEHARAIHHQRHIALALISLGLVELETGSSSTAHRLLMEALEVARESECAENIAASLSALARTERRRANPSAALEPAEQAVEISRRHGFGTCHTWAQIELGLALLGQGRPERALEHTTRALEGLPSTDEAWIGAEEIHRAHARVLETLASDAEASKQARLADEAIQAKADRIADRSTRERYLRFARSRIP